MHGLLNTSYADNRALFGKTYKQHHAQTIKHISISMLPVIGVWKPNYPSVEVHRIAEDSQRAAFSAPQLYVNGSDLPFLHLSS